MRAGPAPRGGRERDSTMGTNEHKTEYGEAEIKEEDRKIRYLRRLVDFAMALIAQSPMSQEEAQVIVSGVRRHALLLFPGKEATFELLYTPRFRRLIAEKFGLL